MAQTLAQINVASDTFEVWVERTNELIDILGQYIVTANNAANGALTTGNVYIVGILATSNILAANTIRGGNVQASAPLTISSNVAFTGEQWTYGNSTVNVFSNSSLLKIANSSGNTQYAHGRISSSFTINVAANVNFTGSFVDINTELSIGNTTVYSVFLGNSWTMANASITFEMNLPTAAQQAQTYCFLHANGDFAQFEFDILGELSGINAQTANYTLILGDKGKTIEVTNAAGCALTVPNNSNVPFPTKSYVDVVQIGAGQVTITPDTGVTLRSKNGDLVTFGQYSGASLYKRGTNDWVVVGDLTTPE
jgi:co-chaperonin GroES (HSP10)